MNAKPYSNTDYSENEAVHLFDDKINRKRIKTDIKTRDKYPNFDGYLEIVDEQNHPKGKMEVQVKAISQGSKKYYCPLENMVYAEQCTSLPILLILSDIENKTVYWKHLHKNNCIMSKKEKSYIFTLSDTDEINESNNYISIWQSIVNDYKKRIADYERVRDLISNSHIGSLPTNLPADAIKFFQTFIDKINDGIHNQYPFIKRIMFPGLWKLGVAINSFSEDISYGLFGIKEGTTDLLIKQINEDNKNTLFNDPVFFRYYAVERSDDPIKYANEFIYSNLEKIFKNKSFDINHIELAKEYIYAFTNKFYYMLGFKKKTNYDVKAILNNLLKYFPIWISEALKEYPLPIHYQFIDISLFTVFPHELIDERVDKIILEDEVYKIEKELLFYSKNYDLYSFHQSLHFLLNNNVDTVESLYKSPNYNLSKQNSPNYIYSFYTKDDIKNRANIFYLSVYNVLRDFLKVNEFPEIFFPDLLPKYKLFIIPVIKDNLHEFGAVGITTIKVEISENIKNENEITIINDDNFREEMNFAECYENGFYYEDKRYKLVSWEDSINIPLFKERPYIDFIYEYLENKLKQIRSPY